MQTRPVGPSATTDDLAARFAIPLPGEPADPVVVIDELARVSEPGLMAMPSGRFFGWVIGGTLPAALAAGLVRIPGVEVLNGVVFTQICLSFGSDERTRQVTQAVIDDTAATSCASR